jgi:hypothetical protein
METSRTTNCSAEPLLECGGLPALSSKLNVRQQNDPGDACLARAQREHATATEPPTHFCASPTGAGATTG